MTIEEEKLQKEIGVLKQRIDDLTAELNLARAETGLAKAETRRVTVEKDIEISQLQKKLKEAKIN